jgi:hypothetical protein
MKGLEIIPRFLQVPCLSRMPSLAAPLVLAAVQPNLGLAARVRFLHTHPYLCRHA